MPVISTVPDTNHETVAAIAQTDLYRCIYERALIDLWAHLPFSSALHRICDLGCGEGVTTEALVTAFPEAGILALGASAGAMAAARSTSAKPQWIEAPSGDWGRILSREGPFDLMISHNGWPLDWTLEDGFERLIERATPGARLLVHLDLALYAAFESRFGVYADLATTFQRLGHLSSRGLDIWRSDFAQPLAGSDSLIDMAQTFARQHDVDCTMAPVVARLKARMADKNLFISPHLFISLSL